MSVASGDVWRRSRAGDGGGGVLAVPSGDGWLGPSEVAPSDVWRLVLLAGTAREWVQIRESDHRARTLRTHDPSAGL
jgi:hypothetical protein